MNKQVEKKKLKDNIIVLVVSLAVIAAVAAGVLAMVDFITQKPREVASLKSTIAAFRQLQPGFNNDPEEGRINVIFHAGNWTVIHGNRSIPTHSDMVTFYPAEKDGKLISVIAKTVTTKGYGGPMTVLLSMTPGGVIENVVVTENTETPGLGTTVIDRTVQKTIWGIAEGAYKNKGDKLPPNPILDFFSGKEFVADSAYNSITKNNPDIIPASKWKVQKDGGCFKYVTGATITSRAVTAAVKKMVSVYYYNKKQILKVLI